jgi:hypothetical protein
MELFSILILLAAVSKPVEHIPLLFYSEKLLMMDIGTVRNM